MWAPSSSGGRAMGPSVARAALTPRCPADIMPGKHRPGRWKEIGMEPRAIATSFTTMFTFDYGMAEADMRRLYENAKRDQWNAARDIPWSTPPPSDGRAIADELIDIYGSALWDRLPEAERVQLNRRIAAWRLSALMHGEQGALLATSQLVDIVKGADAKFFRRHRSWTRRATTRSSTGTSPSAWTIGN